MHGSATLHQSSGFRTNSRVALCRISGVIQLRPRLLTPRLLNPAYVPRLNLISQVEVVTDPHKQAVNYFTRQMRSRTFNQRQKVELTQKLIDYLRLDNSISSRQLYEWCKEIKSSFSRYDAPQPIISSYIYCLQTLLLKNHSDHRLVNKLNRLLKNQLASINALPYEVGRWIHGTWEQLERLLGAEQRLGKLAWAISNKQAKYITTNLDRIIQEIFSKSPPTDLSSQTRVAAIAILYHLLYTDQRPINDHVKSLMESLISNKHGEFFLFKNEESLIEKLLNDLRDPQARDVRPHNLNGRTTILTPAPPPDNASSSEGWMDF
ncbi:uncharacterized protein PGTG_13511 [Puccinia graminis f. sp. tritici CRL 75-36-700-3]|uniref:Uncharacterized protein n=1 Tax=Puccinia graminis f. sp. tritici (strain CRL 75-36-700-3 / race SCCL) TaxID=418459 RepID=E3KTL8_PUCGT|nr:uncharacterized protein PGTG_13511 [Puccinia graminis f. sp. tritici CRL 75-36-700-3]EFP87725.2 hypothetical protein PGTG_13511 [Puccinia graminis f. sp. tritici CRL 75-36-700-3]